MSKEADVDEFHGMLAIDRDDLDRCLMEQPDIYYQVSQQLTLALAERDAIKLDLDEAEAKLGGELRENAAKDEALQTLIAEKETERGSKKRPRRSENRLTEGAIREKLQTAPKLKSIRRDLLEANQLVNSWSDLKEAFRQRSFMLRELVSLRLGERSDSAMERGAWQVRAETAERNREDIREARRVRRVKSS